MPRMPNAEWAALPVPQLHQKTTHRPWPSQAPVAECSFLSVRKLPTNRQTSRIRFACRPL